MKVTLNVILESLGDYNIESFAEEASGISFRQARLLESNEKSLDPDFLYIGLLSDVMTVSKRARGVYFICVRDKEISERERDHFQPSIIIIKEKITPARLLAEVQKIILFIQEWHAAMQEAVIYEKGLQGILDLSEPVIGNFISINDSAFSLLAYTKGISIDDEVSLFLIKNGYHSPETMKKFKRVKRFDLWFNAGDELVISTDRSISNYVTVGRVFVHDETNFTNIVLHCNHRELSPGQLDLFKELVIYLGYYIERGLRERRFSKYSSLIAGLMSGTFSDPDVVIERAKSAGIMPGEETAILLLAESNDSHVVFSDRIAHDISQQFEYIKPINYNQRLLLLLNHMNINHYLSKQGIGQKLNNFLEENNVYCGVSDIVDNLLDIPDAYLQAEFALNNRAYLSYFAEQQASQQQWNNIIFFDDHYAEFLLNHDADVDHIWRSSKYGKMLIKLRESDIEKNTNNLMILYSFLLNERRATETAALTYMHRNNVLYRISRIEEMLDIRLDDPTTRVNLLITFLLFNKIAFASVVPSLMEITEDEAGAEKEEGAAPKPAQPLVIHRK